MAAPSVTTREAVRVYELEHNALLRAVQPGGVLHSYQPGTPVEAMLVPRQTFLDTCGLTPFLRMGPYARGVVHDGTQSENMLFVEQRLLSISEAARARIEKILADFLAFHLVHFDGSTAPRFTTARGLRGEFSETLEHVTLFGRLGKFDIIADADSLSTVHATPPAASSSGGKAKSAGSSAPPPNHPTTLQIFILDRCLFDDREVNLLTLRLRRELDDEGAEHSPLLTGQPVQIGAKDATGIPRTTSATPSAVASADRWTQQRTGDDSKNVKGVVSNAAIASPVNAAPTATEAPSPPSPVNGDQAPPSAATSEADDVIVEEDLSPYVSKCEARRQRRMELQETQPEAAPATGSPTRRPSLQPPRRQHANLVMHQYSKESIQNYRQVVAIDNEIGYSDFQKLMGSPNCRPLVRLLSAFIEQAQTAKKNFFTNTLFCQLMQRSEETIATIPMIATSERKTTVMLEGMEKYVTSKLYFSMFNVNKDEAVLGNRLQANLRKAERVTAAQLDAPEEAEGHHLWGQAMFELDGMNFFKSPREKLRCGMRACELLCGIVTEIMAKRKAAREKDKARSDTDTPSSSAPATFGADELLPCFMLLVLRAQPHRYYENVQFIDRFRTEKLRSAEETYWLATLQCGQEYWLHWTPENSTGTANPSTPPPASSHAAAGGTPSLLATPSASMRRLTELSKSSAPSMRRQDLLPSVREATRNTSSASPPATAAASSPSLSTASNAVMDALFGWVSRPSAAAAAATATPGAVSEDVSAEAERDAEAESYPPRDWTPVSSAAMATGAPVMESAASSAVFPTPPAHVCTATLRPVQSAPFFPVIPGVPESPKPASASRAASSAVVSAEATEAVRTAPRPTAALLAPTVCDVLVKQNKPFEALTLQELRAIVEEARVLARQ